MRPGLLGESGGSRLHFVQAAHHLPQIMFVADDAGVLEYVNPPWCAYTGQATAEAADLLAALHPADRDLLHAAWNEARAGCAPLDLRVRLRHAAGQHRRFRMQATRLCAGAAPWQWYGMCTDIEEGSRALESLADADRRSDIFLATLAHELRNPLAPIRNAAQVLMSPGQGGGQQAWAAAVIDRQVAHLALLLDDLLEASRITRGTLLLHKEQIVLRGVVDAAVELARPALEARQHGFAVEGDALDRPLYADPLRLTQVLGILLDNAARYTPPHGGIWLSADTQGDQVQLSVRDNGIGLPAAELDRVFEMFAQVRTGGSSVTASGRGPPEGGLGIGLALARGLVSLHGGSLTASSPGVGGGCVFRVVLPPNTPAQPQPPPPRQTAQRAAAAGTVRVLVVDDNRDAADTLSALLCLAGHGVEVAYDGEQALRLAQRTPPQVALIDIGLPDIDGCEVARRLRREPFGEALYLIATTGWGQAEDRQRTQASGFDRHLVKPIDSQYLLQMLSDRGLRRRVASVASGLPPAGGPDAAVKA